MDTPASGTCRCGHSREHHQHHRPGSDCSACTGSLQCARFYDEAIPAMRLVVDLPPFPVAAGV
jgi:hypothetical protein